MLLGGPDKRDQQAAVIIWVARCPEADDRTRAAADSRSRALLHKVKGNAAFTEGEFSDAMDLWEEALGELGVAYLEVGGGGYYVVGKNLD
jgi:hypothetical protein